MDIHSGLFLYTETIGLHYTDSLRISLHGRVS